VAGTLSSDESGRSAAREPSPGAVGGRQRRWASAGARYALAFGLVGIALAARLALAPQLQGRIPLSTFFIAVVLAAFLAGPGPTATAAILGYLAADWFFIEPVHAVGPHSSTDVVRLVVYLAVSSAVIVGSTHLSRARQRAELNLAKLEREVTERKRVEAALRESQRALREADRRKDEFLGVLAHELRNPLAPIRNSVHVLVRADPSAEQAVRARAIIARQVEHLTRLVDDLLDVKRITTGKLRLHRTEMDLVKQVRETVEDLRALFTSRSRSLELSVPEEPIWISGDRTRVSQLVSNLLHNAAKFTDSGGRVSVTVERDCGKAVVRVRDDGVGVPPELLDRMFEAFFQSDTTLHRAEAGLGLGLSLVRGIAQLHGGAVRACSEGSGKGTEFVVTLPAIEPGHAVASEGALRPRRGPRRRVLIIEDNADAAESLRDVIELLGGHQVYVAADGETGIAEARQHAPDVILCDLGLPVMDGFEVAKRLRATGVAPGARLVALSGYASDGDIDRALRAGFDDHVRKPPDIDRVLALVAEARA
jgi:signal transduction histidine kinase/CheY-like chemotaxis protein